ncbi:hypothetical protein GCM10022197_10200 [Microlunatus spumicola]|uniref:EfeO-type cupredoxin-like domain-containing protein n=1 Tax=Microlunatus spumicola TaxID=81499 RepID=A0ABP6WXC1_9ACTN
MAAAVATVGLTAACGGEAPAQTAPGASASSTLAPLTIPITIANGQVTPNGEKIDAALGQQVVLQVTSDEADEIHAHTGGDGYELEVPAGTPTTGEFTPSQPGSFEVESHHLGKVVVVLNVS